MNKKNKSNQGIKIIKKANTLIEARYRFDVWETRMFLSMLSCIRMEDEDFHTYRIWFKEVIKVFGLKSHQSYDLLRDATKSLMKKTFNVNYTDKDFVREKAYHIIRTTDYLKEGQTGKNIEAQEYIDITIDPEMKPLLLQLKNNFTAYDLRNVYKLGAQPVRECRRVSSAGHSRHKRFGKPAEKLVAHDFVSGAAAEGDRIAEQRPHQAGDRNDHEHLHQHAQHILGAHQAAIKQREAGNAHHQHQGR